MRFLMHVVMVLHRLLILFCAQTIGKGQLLRKFVQLRQVDFLADSRQLPAA